jgi:hypothetical protein
MQRRPKDLEAVEVILASISERKKLAQRDIRTLKSALEKTRTLIEQSKERITGSDKLLAVLSQPPDDSKPTVKS